MMPAVPGLDCKSVQHTTPALEEQAAESTNVSAALQMLELVLVRTRASGHHQLPALAAHSDYSSENQTCNVTRLRIVGLRLVVRDRLQ